MTLVTVNGKIAGGLRPEKVARASVTLGVRDNTRWFATWKAQQIAALVCGIEGELVGNLLINTQSINWATGEPYPNYTPPVATLRFMEHVEGEPDEDHFTHFGIFAPSKRSHDEGVYWVRRLDGGDTMELSEHMNYAITPTAPVDDLLTVAFGMASDPFIGCSLVDVIQRFFARLFK